MDKKRMASNSDIGAAIRRRRLELSLSQEALSSMLEVSYQQVQRYESGTDRLNVEKLQAIAHALSVPICYFFSLGVSGKGIQDTECAELLLHFRKIHKKEMKALAVDFARMVAQWGDKWGGP